MRAPRSLIALMATLGTVDCGGLGPSMIITGQPHKSPANQCTTDPDRVLHQGTFDVTDHMVFGGETRRNYPVILTVQEGERKGIIGADDILFEEVEVSYHLDVAAVAPTPETLAVIPEKIAVPVVGHLPIEGDSSDDAPARTEIGFELIGSGVAEALAIDRDLDGSFLAEPNRYPMTAEVTLRGRTANGIAVETPPFNYPIDLCVNCLADHQECYQTCYDPWVNCE